MKDIEFTAILLLLLDEEGPQSYSQDDLDKAFADRDQAWDTRHQVETDFRQTIDVIRQLIENTPNGDRIANSRLRNQADFYSLFGAIAFTKPLPSIVGMANRLDTFIGRVDDPTEREHDSQLARYYEAARSASSDKGPRETRIEYMKKLLRGD
jgi:hypothetical protein